MYIEIEKCIGSQYVVRYHKLHQDMDHETLRKL